MKKILIVSFVIFQTWSVFGQNPVTISEMTWGKDYRIHITFSNDSSAYYEVNSLYHNDFKGVKKNEMVYYPVSLDTSFINSMVKKNTDQLGLNVDSIKNSKKSSTLWSALHNQIGGGYIHFMNCLLYSLESQQLNIKSPILKRTPSKWKPKPMTKSYQRTQKWEYYIPDNQKLAQKEYLLKQKNGELGDMVILPESFVNLFLNTSEKQYARMLENKDFHEVAIIDLIRILTGSNYLGQGQIDYIQSAVIKSILQYNTSKIPSVIIFDDFNAAVSISLNTNGYSADKIIFYSGTDLTEQEKNKRIDTMVKTIQHINELNKNAFENYLKSYYK